MNEATLGKVGFAAMHDTASRRFHEDAELMVNGKSPRHHSVSFYLSSAEAYQKADKGKAEADKAKVQIAPVSSSSKAA